jgi:TonB-linked SusC/RagA family outer membrane protein
MTRPAQRWTLRSIAAAIAVALSSAAAAAQQAVITGRVTAMGQPLGGAAVTVPAVPGVGATTDASGNFRITANLPDGRVELLVRTIGYRPSRPSVTVSGGRGTVEVALEQDILSLDQMVSTGVAEQTSVRRATFAIGVVDNVQLREAPSVTPLGGLEGRVAGVSLTSPSGTPGAAPALRLRGATSLTGRQDPLIIIDGTITRISLSDIASEDIERVEVIKGAAASSLYGSDAANGVIQIFTKRGLALAENQTSVTFRSEFGQNTLRRAIPNNESHPFELNADGTFKLDGSGNRIVKADRISDNAYPELFDQTSQVFRPGQFTTNYLSVAQRRENANFAVSFQNTRDGGVLNLLDGFRRQNFRLNADVAITEKLDLQTGAFFGRSVADQPDGEGAGSAFFGLRMLEPNIDLTRKGADSQPYDARVRQTGRTGNVSNPLYAFSNLVDQNERDRFTGSFRSRYRVLPWLTAEGNANYDRGNSLSKAFTPTGFMNSTGNRGAGSLSQSSGSIRQYNIGASLSSVRAYTGFTNTTKLAWVYEDQQNRGLSAFASALSVPRVPEFVARDPGATIVPSSYTQDIRNQNLFAVTTFDIAEKLVLDGLIRRDQSSLFGSDQRTANYYRLSGAYTITEDVEIPGVQDLKFRASLGTAGLRPVFDAQYEQFAIIGGLPQPITLGNRDLRPAHSREAEYGFNMGFGGNFSLEYSYSDKRTTDQILLVPVSAVTGYRNQWVNGGTLRGKTHELALGGVLLQRGSQFWRANLTLDRTRQTVEALTVAPFLIGPDPADPNTRIFKIAPGETFGVIYGNQWIRSAQQLETTIAAGKLTGSAADYVVNEEGYYVRKAQWRTADEVPLRASDKDGNEVVKIGDVNPDFTLGLNTQATWRGLSLTAVVNLVRGGQIYNYTRQWPFFDLRDPAFDQRGKAQEEKKNVTYYSEFYNRFDPNDYFVEDGSYLRLRELAVNYTVPVRAIEAMRLPGTQSIRLGIVGRNLFTSTKYSGYDPDVSGPGGGNPFGYRVDYFSYPVYRNITAMIEIGF